MRQPSVSIVIPTHNRSNILCRALDSLAAIQVPAEVNVELVVVANGCTDDTPAAVSRALPTIPFPGQLAETPTANLNDSRNLGISRSRHDIIVLLDDDVWVEERYLTGLLETYRQTNADIVQGRVSLWWRDVQRPEWMGKRIEDLLSCTDYGDRVCEITRPAVVGANLSFRRSVWETLGGFAAGLDRSGSLLTGGGDTKFTREALARGFRVYYSPGAAVRHWVAPHRIELDYLTRISFSRGLSGIVVKSDYKSYQLVGTLISRIYQWLCHGALETGARLRGDRGGRIQHQLRRITAEGGIVGVLRRLRQPAGMDHHPV